MSIALAPIVLISCIRIAFAQSEEGGRQRDLAKYQKAGPYTVSDNQIALENGLKMRASARGFLWTHWRKQQLGFVTIESSTTEGLPVRVSYFVERDRKGEWSICLETRRALLATKPDSGEHFQQSETLIAYSAHRVELDSDGAASDKPISDSQKRDPASYRLILKDRHGKVVEQL